MKEKYVKPEVIEEKFETLDVITASSDVDPADNDVPFGG